MMNDTITTAVVDKKIILVIGLAAVPLLFSGPQLLVGSIVNGLLILMSSNNKGKLLWLGAGLPSLAAMGHGVLFGSFTVYLFYLWPLITLGNWIFMNLGQKNLAVGAVVKMVILASGTMILAKLNIIPVILVNSMGLIQLATALIGGAAAWLIGRRG